MKHNSVPTPEEQILRAIRKYHIRPKKSYGQHFLIDEMTYDVLLETAGLTKEDNVIEIGTGLGTLTQMLCERAKFVVSVEQDAEMISVAQQELAPYKNKLLVPGDFLQIPFSELFALFPRKTAKHKIVANLPYNITLKSLQKIVSDPSGPEASVLMIQKEVAMRITAEPGDLSMIALVVQWFAIPSLVANVPNNSFYPPPEVQSAIVHLEKRKKFQAELPKGMGIEDIFRIAKFAFHQKRKKIANSLAGGVSISTEECKHRLQKAGLDPSKRPQDLTIDDWIVVAKTLR